MTNEFLRAEIITYDPSLLHILKQRFPNDFSFTDFGGVLDEYFSDVSKKTKADLERDYKNFYDFYFSVVDDRNRENRFRRLLGMPMIN